MKGPIEYIKAAWLIYFKKENFLFFAKIMAVLTIFTTLFSYLQGYLSVYVFEMNNTGPIGFKLDNPILTVLYFVLILVASIFYFYSQVTTYLSVFNVGTFEKDIFKLGYQKLWRFFVISFVVGLIIGFGALLLLIPGLIFGIWYSFSLFLVLDKGLGVKDALSQSRAMVKGKFWAILGRNFVFGLFGFLVGFVFGLIPYNIGSILVTFFLPLFVLPSYLLYKDLISVV